LDSKYGAPATLEQIEQAIVGLSDVEWIRLRKMASGHLWGTRLRDPDDLINETIERLIAGRRTWNVGMAFVPWMDSTMKSVAHNLRALKRQPEVALAGDLVGGGDDPPEEALDILGEDGETPLDALLTQEARAMAEKDLAKIEERFKDDQEVGWILMGLAEGMGASDIQAMGEMTRTQYETARKRLRREREKLFPSGRKS
jgi:DNA-directed RNA polymerase specialized sigma24 family protein